MSKARYFGTKRELFQLESVHQSKALARYGAQDARRSGYRARVIATRDRGVQWYEVWRSRDKTAMTPTQKVRYYKEYRKLRDMGFTKWEAIRHARTTAIYDLRR